MLLFKMRGISKLLLISVLLLPSMVAAHPGHGAVQGLLAEIWHSLQTSGMDYLLLALFSAWVLSRVRGSIDH